MIRARLVAAAMALAAPAWEAPPSYSMRRDNWRPISDTHKPAKRRALKKIKKASQKRNRK